MARRRKAITRVALRGKDTRRAVAVAMDRPVNDVEVDVETKGLVVALEFMGLIDRHLRIMIAVQERQRWVGSVDVHHWTCELRQFARLMSGRRTGLPLTFGSALVFPIVSSSAHCIIRILGQ
jgi:hypothetical protein